MKCKSVQRFAVHMVLEHVVHVVVGDVRQARPLVVP